MATEAQVQMRNVTKTYQMGEVQVHALCGLDLAVQEGEFVVIVGPSGSGKTTTLNLIGGLDTPTRGELIVAGTNIAGYDEKALTAYRRGQIGFIFQFFNLLPTLTAEENIALPLLIDGQNIKKRQEKIDRLLELVGLVDRRHHKPDQLSGGQQQRVAIARAFVTDPAIVLADEPTGNLDSKTGEEILELLRRSCDELGQTIVVVTHDAKAASFADRVVFLMDGRIVDTLKLTGDQAEDIRQIQRHLRALEM